MLRTTDAWKGLSDLIALKQLKEKKKRKERSSYAHEIILPNLEELQCNLPNVILKILCVKKPYYLPLPF